MKIEEIKKNLGRQVIFTQPNGHKSRYILTACIIRKHQKTQQFYYQAELRDIDVTKALVYCGLEQIEAGA